MTEPIDNLPAGLPVLREPSACFYAKEDAGKLIVGAFEPEAEAWGLPHLFVAEALQRVVHRAPVALRGPH